MVSVTLHVPPEIMARLLRESIEDQKLGAVILGMIERGLDDLDARRLGGRTRRQTLNAAERTAQARYAANVRWGSKKARKAH